MLAVARDRFAADDRTVLVEHDLAQPLPSLGRIDAVVSSTLHGARCCYRNAPNHTYVPYDPGEAIEIVLLASLLMRRLDPVAARLGQQLTRIP